MSDSIERVRSVYPKATCHFKGDHYAVLPGPGLDYSSLGSGNTEAEAWKNAADELDKSSKKD